MSKVQLPVHKNETVTGTVLDLTYQGNGVVKVDHYPIFVPNTLPGEEVTVKVTKVTKNFAWGKLISIEKKRPDRSDNPNWACGWLRANRRPVFTNVVAMTWCQLKTFTSRTRQLTKPFWWSATSCVSTKCRLTMKKLTAA